MRLGNLLLKLRGLSPLRYAATKCGHRTKRTGNITAFGQTIMVSMPKNKQGSVDHCLECIGKMAIRCAWCENPIFISEPITLYSPGPSAGFFSSEEPSDIQKAREHNDFAIPDYAVAYREDPLTLVGCFGWNCLIDLLPASRGTFNVSPRTIVTGRWWMYEQVRKFTVQLFWVHSNKMWLADTMEVFAPQIKRELGKVHNSNFELKELRSI